jgi:N-acetylglutamate synthase
MNFSNDVDSTEERALNAWPALQTVMICGWALRLSGGFTKRANSVNALCPFGAFEDVKLAAEAVYANKGLPAIFRISPLAPPDADLILAASGYSFFDPSLMMTAPLDRLARAPAAQIDAAPTDAWLEGFAGANGVTGAMRHSRDAIVRAIAMPAAFATIRIGEAPVGFGLGVVERGFVGLFDIVVVPEARGRGLGRALTLAIMNWGRDSGAEHAYLAVRRANAVALDLYANLGFSEAYGYHYRVPPHLA